MPTTKEIDRFKKSLLKMREKIVDHTDQLERDVHTGSDGAIRLNHMADAATDTFETDFSMGRLESDDSLLLDIEEALKKIENGEFGKCDDCGKNISQERLRAIPFASLCLSCQEENEGESP